HVVSKKHIRRHVQGSWMDKRVIEAIVIWAIVYRPAVVYIGITGLGVEASRVSAVMGFPAEPQMPFPDASGNISRLLEHSGDVVPSRFHYRFGKSIDALSCFFGAECIFTSQQAVAGGGTIGCAGMSVGKYDALFCQPVQRRGLHSCIGIQCGD